MNLLSVFQSSPFLTLAALAILASGCSIDTVSSKDVLAKSVQQGYDASYSEDSQQTTLDATFRVGGSTGTTIQLDSPSQLQVNDQLVESFNFLGTHYSKSLPGYQSTLTVKWTDQNGVVYSNPVAILPLQVTAYNSTASVGSAYVVNFTAPGLAAIDGDNWISATLTQTAVDGTQAVANGTAGAGVVTFSSVEMAKLAPGTATLSVVRTHFQSLTAVTEEGGTASSSYRAKSIAITIQNQGTMSQLGMR